MILQAPLWRYTTLRAGGPAERLLMAHDTETLASAALESQKDGTRLNLLGWGSNVLPSDLGLSGLTVVNASRRIRREGDDLVTDSGVGYQELFLFAAQRSLSGLEYAVGIPGTLGGAMVSNAGAYRRNLDEFVVAAEVVHRGERKWVDGEFFQFRYRDSVLRDPGFGPCVVLRVRLRQTPGDPLSIYRLAAENQSQRIGKQPAPASAGSFFKNVTNPDLAERVVGLTEGMRNAGVVPAGFLLEQVGFKGRRHRGAMFGARHANFMLNVGRASATSIRSLAHHGQAAVRSAFGVELVEEVLYLGDWSRFVPEPLDEP